VRAAYPGRVPAQQLVVGFDLDMTLIDTRPGIAAVWEALAAETGTAIDSADAVSRLGPPLDEELARWFPAEQVAAMGDRFRALYPELAVHPVSALQGARAAIDAVHAHGGRVVVVTGKYAPNAQLHLDHLGLEIDELHGWLWGPEKAVALREHGASVYVGDHLGDIAGARAADAVSVAVPTGPICAEDLRAAGADVVLDDLSHFPAWLDEHVLETRLAALDDRLRELGSVAVAFSGGADSAFLLARAVEVLGAAHVLAATAVSGSLPAAELVAARALAADLGVDHVTPDTHEIARDGYAANAGDRCYFCKAELLDVVLPIAAARGLAHVATGTNADDAVAGFRPGIAAARERGAVTPLLDAGLTKGQVRTASRRLGLPTWDKPAAACLSSRVAYGVTITPARLARVERAEEGLRAALRAAGLGVRDLRVRDLGDTARVEVDSGVVEALRARDDLLQVVRDAGFPEVEVDPRGFRSGSMNDLLPDPVRYR
jgi:pyridinium-3,5-biscarboxylic acid mononucleotide sulfurtransferase